MKVFILGATGIIGLPTAQAFVRKGYTVYALARTPEKAKQLAAEEIIPILGEASKPSEWVDIVGKVDVVIEAIGGTPELQQIGKTVFEATTEAAKKYRPAGAVKLAYIYTSGGWVHGDNRKNIVTDTSPPNNPPALVSWRPPFEQSIINSTEVNGIVVRPGLIYGRSASILTIMFQSAYEGQAKWPGTPGGRFALIHPDDIAELYVLVAEKSSIVGGKIFDAANDVNESVDDVLQKLTEVSGAKLPHQYYEPTNVFETAITTTVILRPYLARALLGWQPRKAGLVDNLELYYNTWKAIANKA